MKFIKIIVGISFFVLMNFVNAQNEIAVEVKTNINSFECLINHTALKIKTSENKTIITIPVAAFKCPKKMIEKDLQSIFEVTNYPNITLNIHTYNLKKQLISTEIQIKSIKKNYFIDVNQMKSKLIGEQIISLTDFGITPPTKMMGTVKVKDQVKISFKFNKEILKNLN